MSLNDTLFIGSHSGKRSKMPLQDIVDHHSRIRDAIATTGHIEPADLKSLVTDASFIYAFNAYKAIGLLLPELYHESGAVVVRQLWEVSLNLHWIALDPEERTRDFCNFTVMEYRKLIQKSGEDSQLGSFDEATSRFQETFRYNDGRGRERTHANFATTSVYDRAAELGEPWKREYELVYHLTSLHAHGAPAAILHAIFLPSYSDHAIRESNSASLIAILAIQVIVRDLRLLIQMGIIPDAGAALEAYGAFEKSIGQAINEGSAEESSSEPK